MLSANWPAQVQVLNSWIERGKSEINPAHILAAHKTDLTQKSVWQYRKNITDLFLNFCSTQTKLNSTDLFHKTYSKEIINRPGVAGAVL